MGIKFDWTVKLSDILTSLSFVLAIIALVYNQAKDRSLADANRVQETRGLLSDSLGRLQRLRRLELSLFTDLGQKIVQTTEIWSREGNVVAARDYIWREIDGVYLEKVRTAQQEELQLGQIGLYKLNTLLAERYRTKISEIEQLFAMTKEDMQEHSQQAVLSFQNDQSERVTAVMGNSLRQVVGEELARFDLNQKELSGPIEDEIVGHLKLGDSALLDATFSLAP